MSRLYGEVCGRKSYLTRYVDGKDWVHVWVDKADPLRFVCAGSNRIMTPPDGFVHDFASIPRLCWVTIGNRAGDGNGAAYGPAAVLHDWAYVMQKWSDGQPMTRWEADALFFEAMLDYGVDEWRARAMYYAVRLGGWVNWNRRAKHKGGLR